MNSIAEIFVYLGVIAAMSERIMEVLKLFTDLANKIRSQRWRMIVIHCITFTASVLAATIYPPDELAVIGKIQHNVSIIVVGLLGSAGSGVWHDLLSTITAFKEQQQAKMK